MPQIFEIFTMDSGSKKKRIHLSYRCIVLLVLLFVVCNLATGLLVYYNSVDSPKRDTQIVQLETETSTATSPKETTNPSTDRIDVQAKPKRSVRLPKSVTPSAYRLSIVPFIYENFTFEGDISIDVNVNEATSNITLHINELTIDEGSVKVLQDSREISVSHLVYDKALQFFIINFPEPLKQGNYSVSMQFAGVLNNVLQGFYRSSYPGQNGTRWIAATQFQPTDARRAFPCFDEPALKATFEVAIGRPNNMSSISNMPRIRSHPFDGDVNYTWDFFERSVPMSTYLVAFLVSDFESRSVGNFSVWARKSAIDQTAYSLEVGPIILKYYEKFFDIPFPLAKIDLVALPDFSAGAMENWGLITFRESNLLYDEVVSSLTNKQSIAIVVAHELAHQWFGNLVTPSWWTDLWLNEGFASYLEYIGTDAARPDLKVLDQFVVQENQVVFSLDALKSSHPISIEVNDPEEINDIFDRISYGKGSTIIRMMDHFLSTPVFQKGLTNFLNEKMYQSAQQDDLWESLTEVARSEGIFDNTMSVKIVMDTWTLQTGFPVVFVSRKEGRLSVRQEKFSLNGSSDKEKALWWIPLTYANRTNERSEIWLRGIEKMSIEDETKPSEWLLVNLNQSGYYRVNYDDANWALLTEQLNRNHTIFDPKNRAQIIDDALNLASAGYLNYSIAMNVTKYLANEKDFVPWKAAFKGLDYMHEMFMRSEHFDKFKDYMLRLILPLYNELGFRDSPKDPPLVSYLRNEILPRVCRLSYKSCIYNSSILFDNWRASPNPDVNNPIAPNMKVFVYCSAIRMGGEDEWNFAWERYLNTNVGTERETILAALACTEEVWLLNRFLSRAVTEGSGIRKQDAPSVLTAVGGNVIGQGLTYRFMTNNFAKIKKYMGSSFISLNGIIRLISQHFNTRQDAVDLSKFAAKENLTSRPISQAIEQAWVNVDWMDRNFATIVSWLKNN
ncbi:PREDICTED: aminopeptidase N-like [Nicrophorus vespilloides]|uniref:Aminopeptidase n=1 Tax=Nicrophorus vespilloides TaxID=110193 RepID=A0ABM1MDT4_NICVS|nr:PREDICTED: aminopeptidase N-like [Nicrophorus vespilloides]